jgi:hypothetical protein
VENSRKQGCVIPKIMSIRQNVFTLLIYFEYQCYRKANLIIIEILKERVGYFSKTLRK